MSSFDTVIYAEKSEINMIILADTVSGMHASVLSITTKMILTFESIHQESRSSIANIIRNHISSLHLEAKFLYIYMTDEL